VRTWRIVLLALGGLRRTPLRVVLTTLGVTIASGALVCMVGFALGVQEQAEAPFRTLGLINVIRVSPRGDAKTSTAAPLDDAALARMGAIQGVEVAYPDLRARGIQLSFGEKSSTVVAMGIPRQAPLIETAGDIMVAGDDFSPERKPEVILATRVVRDLGFASPKAAVGATVRMQAAGLSPDDARTFTFSRQNLAVQVVGVYEFRAMMPGPISRVVLLPVDVMSRVPGIRFAPAIDRLMAGGTATSAGYSRAMVRVRHHADLFRVEKAIQAMGFKTRTLLSRLQGMRTFFLFIDILLAAIGTVALVVAGLGIVNVLLISVLERTQEIGICKAIGASRGDVVVLFLTEAGIIGFVGGLCGLLLGRGIAWVLEAAANAFARSHGVTAELEIFALPLWLLVTSVIFACVISVVAGFYPAVRASRVDPIEALRQ